MCLVHLIILPVSMLAQDTAVAMLRNSGGVLLNRNRAPASSALYRDDLVETQKNTVARIEATGSTADINPETMITFEGDELVLDHGSLSVNTTRGMKVRVGCLLITPAHETEWTHYEVLDQDGKVTVSAIKSDVNIEARSRNVQEPKPSTNTTRVTVREGEQKSRTEKCGAAEIQQSHRLAGDGAWLNSSYVKWSAVAVIVGGTCWAVCRGDDPISPSSPSDSARR